MTCCVTCGTILKNAIGSRGDTLSDDEVLRDLRAINKRSTKRVIRAPKRQAGSAVPALVALLNVSKAFLEPIDIAHASAVQQYDSFGQTFSRPCLENSTFTAVLFERGGQDRQLGRISCAVVRHMLPPSREKGESVIDSFKRPYAVQGAGDFWTMRLIRRDSESIRYVFDYSWRRESCRRSRGTGSVHARCPPEVK
jgi:hypothetical protein